MNDTSLGIQVVPTFIYDLTDALEIGKNKLTIEVATSLEREMSKDKRAMFSGLFTGTYSKPKNPSGISGEVNLYIKK